VSFLAAEWRNLAIANYEIDKSILADFIPFGTELDLWNNKCYVSLVGFMFINTKLLGIKIPFHTNFEEVNLRFYVKKLENNEWKRGVVFIKEIVPKSALTFVANMVYNENYETMEMNHIWEEDNKHRIVEYKWGKTSNWHSIKIIALKESKEIELGSETEFITEHYWGYAKVNEAKTNEYEVTRPKWKEYNVIDYEINVDFGIIYGNEFQFLSERKPTSIMLADGSEITIENKRKIEKRHTTGFL